MKHIIVTTPKSQMKQAEEEAKHCIKNGGGYYFRKVGKKPSEIENSKSFMYYVEDGYIRGRALIIGSSDGEQKCDTSGKIWDNGILLWMPACSWEWIKPIPMKGFQGWRYFDDSNVEVVGGWKDPKPQP